MIDEEHDTPDDERHEANSVVRLPLFRDTPGTRPERRSECIDGVRPCPWATCREHMVPLLFESKTGRELTDDQVLELLESSPWSCTLDAADAGGMGLDDVGSIMGLSGEMVRQLEGRAFKHLRLQAPFLGEDNFIVNQLVARDRALRAIASLPPSIHQIRSTATEMSTKYDKPVTEHCAAFGCAQPRAPCRKGLADGLEVFCALHRARVRDRARRNETSIEAERLREVAGEVAHMVPQNAKVVEPKTSRNTERTTTADTPAIAPNVRANLDASDVIRNAILRLHPAAISEQRVREIVREELLALFGALGARDR